MKPPILLAFLLFFTLSLAGCELPRPEPVFPLEHIGLLQDNQIAHSVSLTKDTYRILSISGGGPNGAWTAGVVNGWKEPQFDAIVGVSTGAMAATPIYLNRLDDLKSAYTETDNSDIYNFIKLCDMFDTTSLSTNRKLEATVNKYLSDEVIDAVAKEYISTRRLLVVCATDLDTGRVVSWNLGVLAANKDYVTYRKAILASAAIPIVFPPVEIGTHLFVDGGARANVFLPQGILRAAHDANKKALVQILLNTMPSELGEGKTPRSLGGIATRSVSTLIDSATIGNLTYIQAKCLEFGFEFYVGQPAPGTPLEGYDFNREKMTAIYECGLLWGKNPKWQNQFVPNY